MIICINTENKAFRLYHKYKCNKCKPGFAALIIKCDPRPQTTKVKFDKLFTVTMF